jgi:translation initiation factor 2 beta subunit (eIF-2beta)/eIF-5
MKRQAFFILICIFIGVNVSARIAPKETNPNDILTELSETIKYINAQYASLLLVKKAQMIVLNRELKSTKSIQSKVDLLIQKDQIQDQMVQLQRDNANDISKIRYLKGLQIIKILYEKVLSLDHHFASVRTFNEISKIGNPNQYPEYEKLKELVASKKDKKTGFELSNLLGANPITSVVQTFTGMLTSSLSKEEKEKELAKVECILDFTLRMQNDLNTIYFETAFLQTSNEKIKQDIEMLFRDYTKPINYTASLENCRTNDDWENLTQKMEEYLSKMKETTGSAQYKMQVNMDFPIDRLLLFISQYNNFIDQGAKFYEKFSIILNSYENQKQCESKLPLEYKKLKADINVAIEKFNVAYKPVEINGTKMKEILYGLNEFD